MKRRPARTRNARARFERALRRPAKPKYTLMLFVAGATAKSARAIIQLKKFCEHHLRSRYQLQVVDIYQQPAFLRKEQIVAAPTLIKQLPLPMRRFVGDLSDAQRLIDGLNLESAKETGVAQ